MAGLLVHGLTRFALASAAGQKALNPEQRAARRFDFIRQQPSLLLAFLRDMPKGGDLHNHLFGAIYAEGLIDFAAQDGFCVDRTTSILIVPPWDDACDRYASKPRIACAYRDHVLYDSIVDAWSMRNWVGEEPGHDHFSRTFDKFQTALFGHIGDTIAEATARAAADPLQYLELMHTADDMQAANLGAKVGWDDDFPRFREKLLPASLKDVAPATRQKLDHDKTKAHQLLRCDSCQAEVGCRVHRALSLSGAARASQRTSLRPDRSRLRTGASRPALRRARPGDARGVVRAGA